MMFQSTFYLIYGYVRPLLKWLLHTFTRLSELQRICYGHPEGSVRTKGVEQSLRLSRQPAIKHMIIFMDQRMEEEFSSKEMSDYLVPKAVQAIVTVKKIDPKIHPDFRPLLRGCVETIWGYQRLYHIVERLRCTQFDNTNLDHERKLLRLWELLCPSDRLESRITKQWQDIGFQVKKCNIYVCKLHTIFCLRETTQKPISVEWECSVSTTCYTSPKSTTELPAMSSPTHGIPITATPLPLSASISPRWRIRFTNRAPRRPTSSTDLANAPASMRSISFTVIWFMSSIDIGWNASRAASWTFRLSIGSSRRTC